jgi:DNA primase
VTAANGVEGFGPDHWALFRESNVKRVLLAFDSDPAGDKAAVKPSAQMIGEDMEVFRVEFPKGFDVNDVAVQSVEPADALEADFANSGRQSVPPVIQVKPGGK